MYYSQKSTISENVMPFSHIGAESHIADDLIIGHGSFIEPGCSFGQRVQIEHRCYGFDFATFGDSCRCGDNVRLGAKCTFVGTVNFGNFCTIGARSKFAGLVFADYGCIFGPDARITEIQAKICSFGAEVQILAGDVTDPNFLGRHYVCCTVNTKKLRGTTTWSISGFGSVGRKCMIVPAQEGLYIKAGCFWGTDIQFEERLERHEAKEEYLAFLAMIRSRYARLLPLWK